MVIFMSEKGFQFKKSFGQNFLKDDSIVTKIVDSADIGSNDLVIEIGPGSGMLTKQLAPKAKNILCYEIDKRLESILDKNLKNFSNVSIIFDDFLKRNIKEDIKNFDYDNILIIANLPYYITTPIITKLIEANINLKQIVIMVQKEVGDRFSAGLGSKDYGSLTVFLNYYFKVKKLFIVSRNCFMPKPNVESVVVSLSSKENRRIATNEKLFFRIVKDSFRFKRKSIKNNLKLYDSAIVASALEENNFTMNHRAEQITLDTFIDISDKLDEQTRK